MNQIKSRKKFGYNVFNYIRFNMKKCCCRRISKSEQFKYDLYQNGKQKVCEELDVRVISQELRTLKFISVILLKKYQRYMIPHFKANLLNVLAYDESSYDKKSQLEKNLLKVMEKSREDKID